MEYRKLTDKEISVLTQQGCRAEGWGQVWVKEGFLPENVRNVRIEGQVKLGRIRDTVDTGEGIMRQCGIINACLRNCVVGDQVLIENVGFLSNYFIEDRVVILRTACVEVTGETSFGNGTEVDAINEAGGRGILLYENLSAPVAYLLSIYRHDPELIQKITGMIRQFAEYRKAGTGLIRCGAKISDCQILRNVRIGPSARLSGVTLLENGTIMSKPEAPVYAGPGVIARNFIIHTGSSVDSGVQLLNCFVGQGVQLGKQLSAENSLFFANCEGFHSEICSIFAGPYTVTHHKSTLLIAAMYSFFNAGSGTNHSNHMYKLGPVHQGIFERGSKCGSFAYILLPSHIAPYTVVMGKQAMNFDASEFPFSYIRDEDGHSVLYPGMNLFTVGTRRDSLKWPTRDRRKDPEKLDPIHFDLLNPYIIGKCVHALDLMQSLAEKAGKKQEWVQYKGLRISRVMLNATRRFYEMAIRIFLGNELIRRMDEMAVLHNLNDIRTRLEPSFTDGTGEWTDLCGLFAPKSEVDHLIHSIKTDSTGTLEAIREQLETIYRNYPEYTWSWTCELIKKIHENATGLFSKELILHILDEWKTNRIKLNQMVLADTKKEFDPNSKIGYGLNGDEKIQDSDFEAVRGSFEENKFVRELLSENNDIVRQAEQWDEWINKMV